MAYSFFMLRLLWVWLSALLNNGLHPSVHLGDTVICLFLVGTCGIFCRLGLVLISCRWLWLAFRVLVIWTGQQECAPAVVVRLSGMKCTCSG